MQQPHATRTTKSSHTQMYSLICFCFCCCCCLCVVASCAKIDTWWLSLCRSFAILAVIVFVVCRKIHYRLNTRYVSQFLPSVVMHLLQLCLTFRKLNISRLRPLACEKCCGTLPSSVRHIIHCLSGFTANLQMELDSAKGSTAQYIEYVNIEIKFQS